MAARKAEQPAPTLPCCEGARRVEAKPGDATTLTGWACPTHGKTSATAQAAPDGGRLSERMRGCLEDLRKLLLGTATLRELGALERLMGCVDEVSAIEDGVNWRSEYVNAEARILEAEASLRAAMESAGHAEAKLAAAERERDEAMAWKTEAFHQSEMREKSDAGRNEWQKEAGIQSELLAKARRERDEAVAKERARCLWYLRRIVTAEVTFSDAYESVRDGKPTE